MEEERQALERIKKASHAMERKQKDRVSTHEELDMIIPTKGSKSSRSLISLGSKKSSKSQSKPTYDSSRVKSTIPKLS
jgi:hypothetical protein